MALSDEELLKLCSSDELQSGKALTLLITRYMPIITLKANAMKQTGIETQDLISEGLLGLLSAIRNYKNERGGFRPFAEICIRNKMLNALQKSKQLIPSVLTEELESVADEQATAEEQWILKEQNKEISSLLTKTLSKMELEVVLSYLDGCDYASIANQLNISVKSVSNAMQRARKKLKIQLLAKS